MKVLLNIAKLKIILAHKNKNYTWLAIKMKTSPQYVSALFNGYKNPSGITRYKIQKIFNNCRWDDLFVIKETEGEDKNETDNNC